MRLANVLFEALQHFRIFRIGDTREIAAHAEPGPAGLEIDQQDSDSARGRSGSTASRST